VRPRSALHAGSRATGSRRSRGRMLSQLVEERVVGGTCRMVVHVLSAAAVYCFSSCEVYSTPWWCLHSTAPRVPHNASVTLVCAGPAQAVSVDCAQTVTTNYGSFDISQHTHGSADTVSRSLTVARVHDIAEDITVARHLAITVAITRHRYLTVTVRTHPLSFRRLPAH
jgi:hypothetical protein